MLELLAQNHKMWVRMVMSFGALIEDAEDIVQSFYIRMHKYIKDESRIMYNDDEVNRFFVYVTLKNMYRTYMVAKSKNITFEFFDDEVADESDDILMQEEMGYAFDRLMGKINKEMNTWHRYDRILSDKYFRSDYSLRDIANGSGISLTSIFNSIRANKKILKEKFGDDYEDFKNQDYHLI